MFTLYKTEPQALIQMFIAVILYHETHSSGNLEMPPINQRQVTTSIYMRFQLRARVSTGSPGFSTRSLHISLVCRTWQCIIKDTDSSVKTLN